MEEQTCEAHSIRAHRQPALNGANSVLGQLAIVLSRHQTQIPLQKLRLTILKRPWIVRAIFKVLRALTNNAVVNPILVFLKLDASALFQSGKWTSFKYDSGKSSQLNAGFSHTEQVEEAIRRVKTDLLDTAKSRVPEQGSILDIGCGPGIYMKLIRDAGFQTSGIDLSPEMIEAARTQLPDSRFYCGSFLDMPILERFDMIQSVSMLEYVPVSRLREFFERCAQCLKDKGVIFIHYPHALRLLDLFYPDRHYIDYSPRLVAQACKGLFEIRIHRSGYDGHLVDDYDRSPYPAPQGKIFLNGYLLVAEKR